MINPQWLELPMSRMNFHGPKDIRAIEVSTVDQIHLSNQGLFAGKLTVLIFLEENICCGYSLEEIWWGASNENPQHVIFKK